MKKLFVFLVFSFFILYLFAETYIPAGDVSGNWSYQNQPYFIEGNISIPADQALTIEAGVEVIFQGHYKFTIYGKIIASGTANDSIRFTATNTDEGWHGMRFSDTSSNGMGNSILNYCKFEYGIALSGNEDDVAGGALSCFNSDNLIISNCRFTSNQANYGGALYIQDSDIQMQSCVIDHNEATHDGGGLVIRTNAAPTLNDVTVSHNTCAYDGGGLYICDNGAPIILDTIFSFNSSEDGEGAAGGALSCRGAYPVLENCYFSHNYCINGGGALSSYSQSEITLNNCVLHHNIADWSGGGIAVYNSTINLSGTNISENASGGNGGGIYFGSGSVVEFDPDNRCNIYCNLVYDDNIGNDLNINNLINVEVFVDTFTVQIPTEYYAFPLENFIFDILNAKIEPIAADLYVSPSGSDNNNGLSASEPLRTISHALMLIETSLTDPHTIFLADGEYSFSSSGECFPLGMKSFLTISGTSREQTILNAEQLNSLIFCFDQENITLESMTLMNGNNKYYWSGGIYCESTDIILSNLHIKNCISNYQGGGLEFFHCDSPDLTNLIIENNQAAESGGGICCNYSNPHLHNVTIRNNSACYYGGGLYLRGCSYPVFDPDQPSNIYMNHSFMFPGKDIYSFITPNINVVLDTFTVLLPDEYFVYSLEYINLTINHGYIQQEDNDLYVDPNGSNNNSGLSVSEPLQTIDYALKKILTSEENPHTIYLAEGIYSSSSNSEIFPVKCRNYLSLIGTDRESTILDAENNSCVMICSEVSQFSLEKLTITNGLADHSSLLTDTDSGGCNIASSEDIVIRNVNFSNNRARFCSAIENYNTNLIIQDCLFSHNEETHNSFDDYLGVVSLYPWLSDDYVKIINSTFVDNSVPNNGGVIFSQANNLIVLNSIFHNNGSNNIYFYGWGNNNCAVIDYSDLEGGESSIINSNFGEVFWQEGNIDSDPLFLDPGNGNFYLQAESPCIDTGTAFYEWDGEVILDLSPDEYYGDAPDMGAFEWNGTAIQEEEITPESPAISHLTNYPNPFNPSTTI
nr:hypothetical protein [Candidatus Cloacimonadota bacterium]